jgi:hypothetical protein
MMAGGNLFRQPRQASVRPDIVHKRFGGDRKRLAALRSRRTTRVLLPADESRRWARVEAILFQFGCRLCLKKQ